LRGRAESDAQRAYGVGVYVAATLTIVMLTLGLVTLLATTLPTLRIAKIDPAKTLREE
jgi:macrolide transport system ATP-binding/permease protein